MSTEKEKKNLKVSRTLFWGLGLLVVSIVGFLAFCVLLEKTQKKLDDYELISNEEALKEALDGKPTMYKLTNMLVTGENCEDALGIINKDYAYISYRKQEYKEVVDDSDTDDITYHNEWDDTYCEYNFVTPEKLVLFGNIEIEPCTYTMSVDDINELKHKVKDEYVEKIEEISEYEAYYYPNGKGNNIGNVRYLLKGLPVNTEVAFMATVGDGKIELAGYKENVPELIQNGTEDDLLYEMMDESSGLLAAIISFITTPGAIIMIIVGIVRTIKKKQRS